MQRVESCGFLTGFGCRKKTVHGQAAPPDRDRAKAWYEALERIGPSAVRARLAQESASSHAAMNISTIPIMTKGFAEEWLAWRDQQATKREAEFRTRQIFWTRFAALAASVAASAAVIGWIITIWRK